MKSIRIIALSALVTIGTFSTVFYTACNKDECKDVTCQNGGVCDGGNCICPTGYEGSKCETAARAKFMKTWSAADTQVTPIALVPTYISSIVAGSSITEVKISKFSDSYFLNDVKATVNGTTITIALQTPDNDTFSVSGVGYIDTVAKKIKWNYELTNPANVKRNYSGTWVN
jgi:hypothetical protein